MGRLVEVLAVDVDGFGEGSPLLGANLDSPTVGRRQAASGVEINGWALAPSGPPEAVVVTLDGEVLGRGIWHPREDLAGAFPEVGGTYAAGFELAADVTGAPERPELEVAVEVEGTRLAIARLRLRRHWRGELDPARPPLVSLVVLDGMGSERARERTLASIGRQRHPATELLELGPARGRSAADLRNEGTRRTRGDLILFVSAGRALAPDALQLAIEMLTRRPAASGVLDGDRDGVVAAIYRRSAFEELRGFGDDGEDCDLELAIRAERCGAFFAQGVLVPGGG